jgi:hypothetical protein
MGGDGNDVLDGDSDVAGAFDPAELGVEDE